MLADLEGLFGLRSLASIVRDVGSKGQVAIEAVRMMQNFDEG